ncbi:MAG: cell division protein FtsQ/DivIB [Porticoccaceae bacterium]|nr:cell division protein FtsQ/DivIB [Porticoccaceae bacterium]
MSRSEQQISSSSSEDSRGVVDKLMDNISKIMTLLLFCSIAYGANLAIQHLDKPITKVSIEGAFKYIDHQQLVTLVNSQMNGGFITIDLKALQNVLHQHPWVADVSVQRQWPTYLKINVIEEVPIARWGGDAFLNRLGDKLIIEDNSHLANLPLMTAEFGSASEVMKQYQRLTDLLLPTGLKLSKLKLDRLGAWRIETSSGIQLILGRNQVGEKIRRLVLVWETDLSHQSSKIKTIDLRYPNGLAVSWKNRKSVAAIELNDKSDELRKVTIIHG